MPMALILSNDDIAQVLDMPERIGALEPLSASMAVSGACRSGRSPALVKPPRAPTSSARRLARSSPCSIQHGSRPARTFTCVKRVELGDAALARCQQVVVHTHEGAPHNYLVGVGDVPVASHDPLDRMRKVRAGQAVTEHDITATEAHLDALPGEPQLSAMVSGEAAGRISNSDINAFVRPMPKTVSQTGRSGLARHGLVASA